MSSGSYRRPCSPHTITCHLARGPAVALGRICARLRVPWAPPIYAHPPSMMVVCGWLIGRHCYLCGACLPRREGLHGELVNDYANSNALDPASVPNLRTLILFSVAVERLALMENTCHTAPAKTQAMDGWMTVMRCWRKNEVPGHYRNMPISHRTEVWRRQRPIL